MTAIAPPDFSGFASLPGAPPAGDPGWSAGVPPATTPGATPFTPRYIDKGALSAAQRHEFQAVLASGDRAAFEAFAQRVGEPVPGADPATTETPAADPQRAAINDKLTQHGLGPEAMQAFDHPLDVWTRKLDGLPEGERGQIIIEGEAHVLRHLYGGSEAAMANGVAEISKAAQTLGLNVKAINASGLLANREMHLTALSLARQVNGRG